MYRNLTPEAARRQRELIGQRFGNYTIIAKSDRRLPSGGRPFYACRCDCGSVREVNIQILRSGRAKGCGCRLFKHGMRHTPLYGVWQAMINRCHNPNVDRFRDYGGRGIKVCDRWRGSFQAFFDDMGDRPSDDHQIDRIDNDGDYEPGNCRWVPRKDQQRNKRNNHLIEWKGETRTLVEWAAFLGISRKALSWRIHSGWTIEEAFTRPVVSRKTDREINASGCADAL